MKETLQQNTEHRLTLEKIAGKHWLELRHMKTGNARILYFDHANRARAFFRGMSIEEIKAAYDEIKPPVHKMYDAIN